MAAYFAMRIMKQPTEQAAHEYYNKVFAVEAYKAFQADTDAILIADSRGNLIPTTEQYNGKGRRKIPAFLNIKNEQMFVILVKMVYNGIMN